VRFTEYTGWTSRGRDVATGRTFGPVRGVLNHHTAGRDSLKTIAVAGRLGLPAPLAHACHCCTLAAAAGTRHPAPGTRLMIIRSERPEAAAATTAAEKATARLCIVADPPRGTARGAAPRRRDRRQHPEYESFLIHPSSFRVSPDTPPFLCDIDEAAAESGFEMWGSRFWSRGLRVEG
jgi:hypothetical protein